MSEAAGCPSDSTRSSTCDGEWLLLFYAPYANDLWRVASSVFGSISSAFAKASNDAGRCRDVRVLMQYKLRGDAHMRRRHWHCDAAVERDDDDHVIHLHEHAKGDTDASCAGSFRSFLSWAAGHVAAAEHVHIGVVVMGHGGGVMQICPEEVTGGSGGALRWMDVADVASALEEFECSIAGRVGFVFLQNCCKATLPALWPFRHLQCLLIASPTIIGAPNTYYSALIHHLFTCPAASPATAAATICNSELPQDFALLSVIFTASVQPFALALDALASAAAPHMRSSAAARALLDSVRGYVTNYGFTDEQGHSSTDRYVDVMRMCSALQQCVVSCTGSSPPVLLYERVQSCFTQLQQLRVVSSLAGSYSDFCGLSLFFPHVCLPATAPPAFTSLHSLPQSVRTHA